MRAQRRARSAGAMLFVLVGLAACGTSSGSGPATGSSPTSRAASAGSNAARTPLGQVIPPVHDFGDACRLLTVMEVEAAAGGEPITAHSRTDPQTGSFCDYMQRRQYGGSVSILTIQVVVHPTASEARSAVDELGGSPLPGIGDAARLYEQPRAAMAVFTARGAELASVSTQDFLPQQTLIQLATIVAGRL